MLVENLKEMADNNKNLRSLLKTAFEDSQICGPIEIFFTRSISIQYKQLLQFSSGITLTVTRFSALNE